MRSHPLLLRLGTGAAPDYSLAATSVTMLELDVGFDELRERYGEAIYKAADWRCVPLELRPGRPMIQRQTASFVNPFFHKCRCFW